MNRYKDDSYGAIQKQTQLDFQECKWLSNLHKLSQLIFPKSKKKKTKNQPHHVQEILKLKKVETCIFIDRRKTPTPETETLGNKISCNVVIPPSILN